MRRDVISAYAASGMKIGSWIVVLGLLYRSAPWQFAIVALIRGTIGILNYTTFGLSPAMIRMLAERRNDHAAQHDTGTLSYQTPTAAVTGGMPQLYANGLIIAMISGLAGLAISFVYARYFPDIYPASLKTAVVLPNAIMTTTVFWIGVGTVLRLMSDAPGSVLQAQGRIANDNFLIIEAEIVWTALATVLIFVHWNGAGTGSALPYVGYSFAVSGLFMLARRAETARRLTDIFLPPLRWVNEQTLKRLLAFGTLVMFAPLADYL
jgi:hypothetical protein